LEARKRAGLAISSGLAAREGRFAQSMLDRNHGEYMFGVMLRFVRGDTTGFMRHVMRRVIRGWKIF
jgi:hypothetical protein